MNIETQNKSPIVVIKDDRNMGVSDLVTRLAMLNSQKLDMVVNPRDMRMEEGLLQINNSPLTEALSGTGLFHSGLANKLGIPKKYYDRLMVGAPEDLLLLDKNVNHWLEGAGKSYLIRAIKSEQPYGRAFLSDHYRVIDNYDLLTIIMEVVKSTGIECNIGQCDLTENHMFLRLEFPQLLTRSSALLKNYRTPDGRGDDDRIDMKLVIKNSEVGTGAVQIAPQVNMLVCSNGMTRDADIIRQRHLGGQMDGGVINWSEGTRAQNQKLIVSQMHDAIRTYLNIEYLENRVKELENANQEIIKPTEVLNSLSVDFGITQEERQNIFDHFILGGDKSKFGVAQAVTYEAQKLESAERQYEFESIADKLMFMNLN